MRSTYTAKQRPAFLAHKHTSPKSVELRAQIEIARIIQLTLRAQLDGGHFSNAGRGVLALSCQQLCLGGLFECHSLVLAERLSSSLVRHRLLSQFRLEGPENCKNKPEHWGCMSLIRQTKRSDG